LDALQVAAQYAGGALSPVDVARDCLARIEAWEPKLNAMYRIDREGAMAAATAAETRWRAGKPLSPLDGVPVTIKENIYTRGDPAPIGTRAMTMPRRNRTHPLRPAARGEVACSLARPRCPISACSLGPVQHSWHHAQSVEHNAQYLGLELRRGRSRRGRLCPAAPGHRHRRLGAPARHALRHFRAQAQPRPRAGLSALHRPGHRTDDARRASRAAR
jgi:hypothetical protein